jgi:hypothetical protein
MIGAQSMETIIHCIKRLSIFPSPAGISLTKLSLAGNNLNFSDIPAGDGNIVDLFLQCTVQYGSVGGSYAGDM